VSTVFGQKCNKGTEIKKKKKALIRSYRVLSGSLRQHTIIHESSFPFVSNQSPQNPMFPPRHYTTCLLLLFLVLSDFSISQSQSPWAAKKRRMKEKVRNMYVNITLRFRGLFHISILPIHLFLGNVKLMRLNFELGMGKTDYKKEP